MTLDTLPAPRAYLRSAPARVARWGNYSKRLGRMRALKVGIVWSGSRTLQRNPLRSVLPADYARAFAPLKGVEFISLQIDGSADVTIMAAHGLKVPDYTADIHSFDGSAALISSLDLVVTVCTSCSSSGGRTGCANVVAARRQSALGVDDRSMAPVRTHLPTTAVSRLATVLEQVTADLAALARSASER